MHVVFSLFEMGYIRTKSDIFKGFFHELFSLILLQHFKSISDDLERFFLKPEYI